MFSIQQSLSNIRQRFERKITLPFFNRMSAYFTRHADNSRQRLYSKDEWQAKTVDDFKNWLSTLPDLPFEEELNNLDACDLYTVLQEFTALRQEIKLQNREQNKAVRTLNTFMETYQQSEKTLRDTSAQISLLEENVRLTCEKKMILLFLDVRDALTRGLQSGRLIAAQRQWLRRPPKGIESVVQGYEMALRRFDRALIQADIKPLSTVGKPFNPQLMQAVGKASDSTTGQGIVTQEILSGYIRNDEVIRTAEVIVNM